MISYVSVGKCKKPIVPGEEFPIKLVGGVAVQLTVRRNEQDKVRVVILDVGNVEVLSGLGFKDSTRTNVTMTGDFLLRHIPSNRFVAVISFEAPPVREDEIDLTDA